jgi:hypothetical protein
MISPKSFQHGIKAFTRPGEELAKTVDGHPIVAFRDALTGGLKLLTLGLGL